MLKSLLKIFIKGGNMDVSIADYADYKSYVRAFRKRKEQIRKQLKILKGNNDDK
jgi:hypothetical protein